MIDDNELLSDLVTSNEYYQSRLDELANKLTVTSQFMKEAQFLKEEIERIGNKYIQPSKMGVISGGVIMRQYSLDKFVGYAYDTLKKGYNPKVFDIIKNAENEFKGIYHDDPGNIEYMVGGGVVKNSVYNLLKAGVGYLLYEKFLREKLEQINDNVGPKELSPQDIDEFSRIKDIPLSVDSAPMRTIEEALFKQYLVQIFGDHSEKDWGGEMFDYFTSHAHINGKQVSCAFLLKGLANFSPMKLTHLGKNRDQINRLAKVNADVLIVQHSHDITPEVRETLKAFSLLYARKWYCFIDGRDSVRVLKAWNFL